ncbi:MAG: hypothetical protein H7Y18_18655 [Clostridiaceae bacterium]|nr:hypothetical protein [Clostridiaceae bacterium]
MENRINSDEKKSLIDLTFNKNNSLLQAILNVDVFGKPKCKTRRRRVYGAKSNNRR